MRRNVIVVIGVGLTAVVGIGLLVFAGQQGWFGGRAQRLFTQAAAAVQQGRLPEARARLEELLATFPDSPWADDALLKLGQVYEAQQQLVEARSLYRKLLDRFPDSPLVSAAQAQLGTVNMALLFSPTVTDLDTTYEVQPSDTLGKIALLHGTTVEFIKRANQLKSDVIHPRQQLKVPKGRFTIVVNKSQNQLLLTEENQLVKTYPVATGKERSTPAGTFKVINRIVDPVWYKQGAIVPHDSPENVLGTRWMGLSKEGYGIHGTVDPTALGKSVTEGCVRMSNADVEELFDVVPVGTEVTIVD